MKFNKKSNNSLITQLVEEIFRILVAFEREKGHN